MSTERSIQKTGVSTFTLSLPKPWIQKNKVRQGDRISIVENNDGSLSLQLNQAEPEQRNAVITLTSAADTTQYIRKFIALYLNGVTSITLTRGLSFSPDAMRSLANHMKKVIGFEIVEEDNQRLRLQDFFSGDYLSIENAIRRTFSISKLILREVHEAKALRAISLKSIAAWEEEVNRLYLLVRRQVSFAIHSSSYLNKLKLTLMQCQNYLLLIEFIEKITDAFVAIATDSCKAASMPKSTHELLKQKIELILDVYELAMQSVMKKDFMLANRCLEQNEKILALRLDALTARQQLSLHVRERLYRIFFNIRLSSSFVKDIAQVGLDQLQIRG